MNQSQEPRVQTIWRDGSGQNCHMAGGMDRKGWTGPSDKCWKSEIDEDS